MEERLSGAILASTIPSDTGELHGLDPVRSPHGAPKQPAGGDHQWLRLRD